MKEVNSGIAHNIAKGDREAFNFLYDLLFVYLGKVAFSFVNDYSEAEEIVQDSFIKLWKNRENLDPNQDIKPYLTQIVRNSCINHLNHGKIKLKHQEYTKYVNNVETHDSNEILIEKELNEKINEVIENLPTECKKIFQMSRFQGLKYKEIATSLGIAEKTVEQQISKALKRLKEELVDYLPLICLFIYEVLRTVNEIMISICI